jgi:hypothetical protein
LQDERFPVFLFLKYNILFDFPSRIPNPPREADGDANVAFHRTRQKVAGAAAARVEAKVDGVVEEGGREWNALFVFVKTRTLHPWVR